MKKQITTHTVFLTQDAVSDLEAIHDYIFDHDSPTSAAHVVDKIEKVFESLSLFPERGAYPPELLAVGIKEYREVFFKPYRIVYRIQNDKVYVVLIADGRRDMQTLLLRRLLV